MSKDDKSEEDSAHNAHNAQLTSSPPPLENADLAALCPFTPNPIRENVDSLSSTSSPSSLDSPHSPPLDFIIPSKSILTSTLDHSPRTPRDGVFDPFAPAPDHLLLAPLPKKLLTHSAKFVARRLNFDDDDHHHHVSEGRPDTKDGCTLSDELFLDTVYGTLLEAIVKKQTEDFVAQNHPLTSQQLHTPTSPPPLTGIAHTCPGAPVKAVSRKPRNVTPGWCRKLEF